MIMSTCTLLKYFLISARAATYIYTQEATMAITFIAAMCNIQYFIF